MSNIRECLEACRLRNPDAYYTYKDKVLWPCYDAEVIDKKDLGKKFPLDIEMEIHPNQSGKIIINVPGYNGDINGYNNKYFVLANEMQRTNLGAVIRLNGGFFHGYLPNTQLKIALELATKNGQVICGNSTPEIYLMGFSAGAGSIAATAHEYPEVKKILLIAPSFDMPEDKVKEGLGKFKGEVVIVQGENDDIVGPETGPMCFQFATSAIKKEIFMISNCDHQFKGTKNGQIVAKAPFYAFLKDNERPSFPSPDGGLFLY